MSRVTRIGRVCDAIPVTANGFGGLTCESCRKKICKFTVTRIGHLWDAILVTDDGFGALMCKKCTDSACGVWGVRRTENRDHRCMECRAQRRGLRPGQRLSCGLGFEQSPITTSNTPLIDPHIVTIVRYQALF